MQCKSIKLNNVKQSKLLKSEFDSELSARNYQVLMIISSNNDSVIIGVK